MARYSQQQQDQLIEYVGTMGIPWSAAILDAAMVHEPDWLVRVAERWVRSHLSNLRRYKKHGMLYESGHRELRACEEWLALL